MTDEQLDGALKDAKVKGAERSFSIAIFATIPLALFAGFFGSETSPSAMWQGCALYYLTVAFLACLVR
jgi:hypothetical protein